MVLCIRTRNLISVPMHIAKSGTINMSISNPNKLLLHHPQIIIHCQGSHPTVPAQQQSTREYRSSILKVRWNKPCGMVLLVPAWCGPAGRAKRKASSLPHLGGLRGSAEGVHCSGVRPRPFA